MTNPSEPPAARNRLRVFVGDVQGCATELQDLLDVLGFDRRRHALYFCGDLVNRGPRSLDALRMARALGAEAVLGNHDVHLIARARGTRPAAAADTLDEILAAPDGADLAEWLRQRPAIIEWEDLVLVHAGLHPEWTDLTEVNGRIAAGTDWDRDPMRQEQLRFATTVRYCDRRGSLPPATVARPALAATTEDHPGPIAAPYAPWDQFWKGPRTVVFGHWAQRGLVRRERLRGLDTGCVWGGRLTAWIAEEDRFVSVPARSRYQATS